jgi:hypothetical protein
MPEPPAPPPDLAAIEARYTRATPGPWFDEDGYRVLAIGIAIIAEMKHLPGYPVTPSPHDVAFIAAARTDVPALVAYAHALEAANARLRKGLAETREAIYWAHGKAQTVAHYDSVAMLERAMKYIDTLLTAP